MKLAQWNWLFGSCKIKDSRDSPPLPISSEASFCQARQQTTAWQVRQGQSNTSRLRPDVEGWPDVALYIRVWIIDCKPRPWQLQIVNWSPPGGWLQYRSTKTCPLHVNKWDVGQTKMSTSLSVGKWSLSNRTQIAHTSSDYWPEQIY